MTKARFNLLKIIVLEYDFCTVEMFITFKPKLQLFQGKYVALQTTCTSWISSISLIPTFSI